MKSFSFVLFALVAACSSPGSGTAKSPATQVIVEQVASKHADLVRLTVHAVLRQESRSRVIASNVPAKLDDGSDPEDIQALASKQPVTLTEGAHVDYTAPVLDASGNAIATVGVTVKGSDAAAMRASAERIAREVTAAILAAGKPLW